MGREGFPLLKPMRFVTNMPLFIEVCCLKCKRATIHTRSCRARPERDGLPGVLGVVCPLLLPGLVDSHRGVRPAPVRYETPRRCTLPCGRWTRRVVVTNGRHSRHRLLRGHQPRHDCMAPHPTVRLRRHDAPFIDLMEHPARAPTSTRAVAHHSDPSRLASSRGAIHLHNEAERLIDIAFPRKHFVKPVKFALFIYGVWESGHRPGPDKPGTDPDEGGWCPPSHGRGTKHSDEMWFDDFDTSACPRSIRSSACAQS